ncbi:MAG: 3-dehydroquinate synthase [Legionella sp.]|nr:3-dehydroquinate synthase [Legionella sp.]
MAKFELCAQIDVPLPEHQYPILICRRGLADTHLLRSYVQSNKVCIVTNETIAPLYLAQVQKQVSSIHCDVVILEDGEKFKNNDSLYAVYDTLLKNKHHRDTTIIALGGGVIGDLAGFAASTYQRGVKLIQIPTTLLAQIDASVGGKTAINHALGKNMIGSFYQPQMVMIDLETLNTLPTREFQSGLAEMIKYGLLVGGGFLAMLTQSLKAGLTVSNPELASLIGQCCKIKADFVVHDEREEGRRALLNLGHTVAHALETYTNYTQWLHGEAVAIGLYCAALLSVKLDLLEVKWLELLKEMLVQANLPYKIPATIDLKKLLDIMKLDKKIKNNCIRFVVIKNPGDCYLEDTVPMSHLQNVLSCAQGESSD